MVVVEKGGVYSSKEIEEVITDRLWPRFECATCGGTHLAAIRKIRDSLQGGHFEFVDAECPQAPGEKTE